MTSVIYLSSVLMSIVHHIIISMFLASAALGIEALSASLTCCLGSFAACWGLRSGCCGETSEACLALRLLTLAPLR